MFPIIILCNNGYYCWPSLHLLMLNSQNNGNNILCGFDYLWLCYWCVEAACLALSCSAKPLRLWWRGSTEATAVSATLAPSTPWSRAPTAKCAVSSLRRCSTRTSYPSLRNRHAVACKASSDSVSFVTAAVVHTNCVVRLAAVLGARTPLVGVAILCLDNFMCWQWDHAVKEI